MVAAIESDLGYITQAQLEGYILRQSEANSNEPLAQAFLNTSLPLHRVSDSLMRAMLKFSDQSTVPNFEGRYIHAPKPKRDYKLTVAETIAVEGERVFAVNLDSIAVLTDPNKSALGKILPQGVGKLALSRIKSIIDERAKDIYLREQS
jgi:hypothetical protein